MTDWNKVSGAVEKPIPRITAMNRISLIYTYYNYPQRMAQRMDMCSKYSDFVKQSVDIIIVDDASKIPAHTLDIEYPHNVSIYRVEKDVVWNEKGARNLGAVVANTEWVIFTDFDHWFEDEDLANIVNMQKQDNVAYRFERYSVDGTKYKKPIHSESFLVQRYRALQIGCFSECYTGQWGSAPYSIFYKCFEEQGGRFVVTQDARLHYRSNKEANAVRNGNVTDRKAHAPDHGLLHFEWKRML